MGCCFSLEIEESGLCKVYQSSFDLCWLNGDIGTGTHTFKAELFCPRRNMLNLSSYLPLKRFTASVGVFPHSLYPLGGSWAKP